MIDKTIIRDKGSPKKRYILASDFDQTLSFNDSGYVLAELIGIPGQSSSARPKAWPN